jgi:hypothetical protein
MKTGFSAIRITTPVGRCFPPSVRRGCQIVGRGSGGAGRRGGLGALGAWEAVDTGGIIEQ